MDSALARASFSLAPLAENTTQVSSIVGFASRRRRTVPPAPISMSSLCAPMISALRSGVVEEISNPRMSARTAGSCASKQACVLELRRGQRHVAEGEARALGDLEQRPRPVRLVQDPQQCEAAGFHRACSTHRIVEAVLAELRLTVPAQVEIVA